MIGLSKLDTKNQFQPHHPNYLHLQHKIHYSQQNHHHCHPKWM
jgi:hypothetical protein